MTVKELEQIRSSILNKLKSISKTEKFCTFSEVLNINAEKNLKSLRKLGICPNIACPF